MSLDDRMPAPVIPEYGTIDTWVQISGMGRRTTYDELGRGNLQAVKSGTRLLIKIRKGLQYMETLPPAKIKAPRERIAA